MTKRVSEWIEFSKKKPVEYDLEDLEVTTAEGVRSIAFYSVKEDKWWEPTTYKNVEVVAWKAPSKPWRGE